MLIQTKAIQSNPIQVLSFMLLLQNPTTKIHNLPDNRVLDIIDSCVCIQLRLFADAPFLFLMQECPFQSNRSNPDNTDQIQIDFVKKVKF